MNKEIRKTVYNAAGDKVSYHYHEKGFKTFLIKSGRIKVVVNGQRFLLKEGDMITFEPFCPYGYEVLSKDTQIREINTAFEAFDNYFALDEPADVTDIDKKDCFFVTGHGEGRHIFAYEGIRLLQKTARYQLGGYREIWEYQIDRGYTMQFEADEQEEHVYFVENGTFKVEAGEKTYETDGKDGEPVVIPAKTPYQITALTDDCILHNYKVKAHLFRLLEMLEAAEDYFKEKLEDEDYINGLFEVNKLNHFADFKKTAEC